METIIISVKFFLYIFALDWFHVHMGRRKYKKCVYFKLIVWFAMSKF